MNEEDHVTRMRRLRAQVRADNEALRGEKPSVIEPEPELDSEPTDEPTQD